VICEKSHIGFRENPLCEHLGFVKQYLCHLLLLEVKPPRRLGKKQEHIGVGKAVERDSD
jgi:hypothetical protein